LASKCGASINGDAVKIGNPQLVALCSKTSVELQDVYGQFDVIPDVVDVFDAAVFGVAIDCFGSIRLKSFQEGDGHEFVAAGD
jgi:hypothetical protein